MPINSQLLGNVNPQRTEQPRKGRMDSDSVGLAGVASGRDGGISNWTQSFGEDRNSRSLDSFTARATFQNILRCGLVLQFLQGIIMSPKISPACIHYLHLVLMTSTWIFIQIMTSRYDYALQWRWVSIGQKKSHALEFLKLGMSAQAWILGKKGQATLALPSSNFNRAQGQLEGAPMPIIFKPLIYIFDNQSCHE